MTEMGLENKYIFLIINYSITVVFNDLLCMCGEDKVQNYEHIWELGNLGK